MIGLFRIVIRLPVLLTPQRPVKQKYLDSKSLGSNFSRCSDFHVVMNIMQLSCLEGSLLIIPFLLFSTNSNLWIIFGELRHSG